MVDDDQGWNAADAVRVCPVHRFDGRVWRFHKRRYSADDPAGSLISFGRFNRAWPALYVSLHPHIAVGEVLRHIDRDQLSLLRESYRLTSLSVTLSAMLRCCDDGDCHDSVLAGVTRDDLCREQRFKAPRPLVSQAIAAAALALGVEAMRVPSCTRLAGGNLIEFTAQLRAGSRIEILASEDPELYVDRMEREPGG